jgi:hypothetical protein
MVLKIRHCKTDQKYPENFEMPRWRRMEEINRMNHVKNKKVLHRAKEEKYIQCIIILIGQIL